VKFKIMMVLILMAAGRAMTLAFISRAGDGGAGDPPDAWLMPLVGDAAIGLGAIIVAVLIWRRPTPTTWVIAVVWSALGAFDALAAFIVQTTSPWPEFFMIEIFGSSMFFAAAVLHLTIIYLLSQPEILARFDLRRDGSRVATRPA
jgi:hypothetical protein